MGIGWDSWEAKNLSKIMEKAAIQIHVRAPDGQTMYNLPIVALIEDYEGKQCGATFSFKYAGEFPITDKWQKMLLPLSDFNYDETPINQANVKQLILMAVSSGHVYIDDISLVPFDKPKEVKQPKPVYRLVSQLPVTLFDEHFVNENGWGIINDECRKMEIVSREGNRHLQLSWERGKEYPCDWIEFGISWNKWEPVNILDQAGKATLSFEVQTSQVSQIEVGFDNYSYQNVFLALDEKYVGPEKETGWSTVRVPLKDIFAQTKDMNLENIKQLLFRFQGKGEAAIDNIRLVKG